MGDGSKCRNGAKRSSSPLKKSLSLTKKYSEKTCILHED